MLTISAVGVNAAAAAGAASATAAVALDAASAALLAASCAHAGKAANAVAKPPASPNKVFLEIMLPPVFLECNAVGLARADAHSLTKVEDEDLAVANGAGVRALLDRLDNAFRDV